MKTRPFWFYRQSGVIPYRIHDGQIEILLVTSRSRSRWVIPKGVVEIGMSAADSAAKEAYEEAGVRGKVSGDPLGEYMYEKWNGTCTVQVFLMQVTEILKKWPEDADRRRKWMDIDGAAAAVREEGLRELIRRVGRLDRTTLP